MTSYSDKPATPAEAFAHHGVKGMRWGVRKDDHPGASRSTNKAAAKDAREFARAKMFYGEGAGTRRKLIKAKVESKKKKDSSYAQAFDHHLNKQDLGSHASKAGRERKRKDVVKGTGKTARGIKNVATGNSRAANLSAVVIVAGATFAHKQGWDQVALNSIQNNVRQQQQRRRGQRIFRDMGL